MYYRYLCRNVLLRCCNTHQLPAYNFWRAHKAVRLFGLKHVKYDNKDTNKTQRPRKDEQKRIRTIYCAREFLSMHNNNTGLTNWLLDLNATCNCWCFEWSLVLLRNRRNANFMTTSMIDNGDWWWWLKIRRNICNMLSWFSLTHPARFHG